MVREVAYKNTHTHSDIKFVKLDMDISDIFEIYNIKKIGDGQVLVTQCTTEYKGGAYEENEDGLLNFKQELIGNDTIEGDKFKYVLDKNTVSANIVENKLDKVKSIP